MGFHFIEGEGKEARPQACVDIEGHSEDRKASVKTLRQELVGCVQGISNSLEGGRNPPGREWEAMKLEDKGGARFDLLLPNTKILPFPLSEMGLTGKFSAGNEGI